MSWSAVILAGGRARRLGGQDKRALSIEGVRILERQLAALRPLTTAILCVGGGAVALARAEDAPLPLVHVDDSMPGCGALGGLYTALTTATTDRVLVLACDLPFVTTPFFEFLLRVDPHAAAVVPAPASGPQPLCAMYQRAAAAVLRNALDSGERRVRHAVDRLSPRYVHEAELRRFDPEGRLLWNVNTPDDHTRANAHEAGGRHRTAASETSQTTIR